MLVNTFFTIVTACLVYIFLRTNFGVQTTGIRFSVFIILFGFFNGALSTFLMDKVSIPKELYFIKSFLLLVISVLCIKILLKVNILKAFLSFIIVILGVGLGNAVAPLILMLFKFDVSPELVSKNISLFILVNIFIYIIAAGITLLTPLTKLLGRIKNLKSVVFLLAVSLFVIVSLTSVHYISHIDFVSVLCIFVSTLIYLITSIWYINKFQKYELRAEEQKQQAFYNESLGMVIQDLRRFKHDQANHLTVIAAMLKMNKYEQAGAYISELVSTGDDFLDNSVLNIKNAGLFGLISSKKDLANKNGVKFVVKSSGEIDSIPNVKISELCEVLGIYLDNAIEAATESENKLVEISLANTDSIIKIEIINSCGAVPDIDKIKIEGYSTKGDGRGHGLSIVDKILKKYSDIINSLIFDKENMLFNQSLQIKKGL